MAEAAGMSRTAFSNRFALLAGIPPMAFLRRWRMTLATELFLTTPRSVEQFAEKSGYQLSVTFSKAFKKHFSYGPGEARRRRKPDLN